MSVVVFKRGQPAEEWQPWEGLKPQEWCLAPPFYSSVGWAFAVCPNGHAGTITATHHLEEDRRLVPSYVCPECSFHEWVALNAVLSEGPKLPPLAVRPGEKAEPA